MNKAIKEYRKLLLTIEKKGHKRKSHETLTEFSNRLEKMALPFSRIFAITTKYYLDIRFGNKTSSAEVVEKIKKAQDIIKR